MNPDRDIEAERLGLELRLGRFLNRQLSQPEFGPPPRGLRQMEAVVLALVRQATEIEIPLADKKIAEKLACSTAVVRLALQKLIRLGLCETVGARRGRSYRTTEAGRLAALEWIRWRDGKVELAEMPRDVEAQRQLHASMREQLRHLVTHELESKIQKASPGEERHRAPQRGAASSVSRRREDAMDVKELTQRAELVYQRVYEGSLKAELERTAWGKYVAIDIDTGEYLVAESRSQALAAFHARFPTGSACLVRVGTPLQVA